jgi:hypothetical protein
VPKKEARDMVKSYHEIGVAPVNFCGEGPALI